MNFNRIKLIINVHSFSYGIKLFAKQNVICLLSCGSHLENFTLSFPQGKDQNLNVNFIDPCSPCVSIS